MRFGRKEGLILFLAFLLGAWAGFETTNVYIGMSVVLVSSTLGLVLTGSFK